MLVRLLVPETAVVMVTVVMGLLANVELMYRTPQRLVPAPVSNVQHPISQITVLPGN